MGYKNNEEQIWKDPRPYDSAAKKLAEDSERLVLMLAKEIFHKDYPTNTRIRFLSTEGQKANSSNGKNSNFSDLSFLLFTEDRDIGLYVLEFQSSKSDASILSRAVQYSVSLMMKNIIKNTDGNMRINTLTFPQSGVVFFRSPNKNVINEKIFLQLPNGVKHDITPKFIDSLSYSMNNLMEKNLHFLVPFRIFAIEKELKEAKNEDEVTKIVTRYFNEFTNYLWECKRTQKINDQEGMNLLDTSKYVLKGMEQSTPLMKKGVDEIMAGAASFLTSWKQESIERQELEQKATKRGIEQGIEKGIEQGIEKGIFKANIRIAKNMLRMGKSSKTIQKTLNVSDDEFAVIQKSLGFSE